MRALARAASLIVVAGLLLAPTAGAADWSAQAASACPGAALTPTSANLREVRAAVLCLLNRERTSRGMKALHSNAKLRKAAERHSRNMNRQDFFDHVTPSGSTPLQRVKAAGYLTGASSFSVGENIGWGESRLSTPLEMVNAWMHSAGHRANILRREFRHVGIGVNVGAPIGGAGGATYTTEFGKRT
jgi:uncharacterized protein YkwD